jgi:hypothetical protein
MPDVATESPLATSTVSRRAVVSAAVKLVYAAPVIVGSYHLSTMTRPTAAQELLSDGGLEELPTCTPTVGPEQTPPSGQTPTPTEDVPTDEVEETPQTPRGSDGDERDDEEEILTVKFLPQTGDGSSLEALDPSCI